MTAPRNIFLILVMLLMHPALSQQRQPNVVIIFTDDQGSIDMNCYGATDLITPNMDALARRGVRFTQFYAASPVCSPSRAALLTGKVPQRANVPDLVRPADRHTDMPARHITLAEMLKEAGYATALVGKWHLGHAPETMPNGQGFDYSFGHLGGCIDNYSHYFYWNGPNRHDLVRNGKEVWHPGEFFPDMMVREANNFIEQNRNKPFFLYWAINTPHYPLQAEPRWLERYAHLSSPRKEYAAFVSTTDEKIGQVLAKLEELKIQENTIVIFMSDHGHSTEERTFGGGGNAGPYRGAKFSLFEGGIRVPAIISWPGQLPQNQVRHQMGIGTDWLPTVAELCSIKPSGQVIDGKSLVKVIRSEKEKSPHQVFHWQLKEQWAVREGDWKLIGNPRDTSNKGKITDEDQFFLTNVARDPSEMRNLAGENPQIVERMRQLHTVWEKELSQVQAGAGK
ncbi:sulfatase-like hydrolase/transferase [Rhodocytophaga aerolata]|uniref:Sulfatase-like hydrolase/transferase n=1 Tax=Rhodocytophaga aerolata TaxID=455078 RepID=A0ABT8RGF4_9BACT|nr:sulfatase-like hydrolase/transferase [Rhodocytophaga aerolata]MDO1451192.1 sulfatase-like hydrolase/transferase [Rhodocytophaga aerolata]